MKLLFDHNLSQRLSGRMQDIFPGSLHISEVLARRTPDESIWIYAIDNDFVVITKDSDHPDLSSRLGYPPKVIWIRSGIGVCCHYKSHSDYPDLSSLVRLSAQSHLDT